jgi:uncharacterized protein (TIGR02145 family)
MIKLMIVFALYLALVACKKETTTPNSQNNGNNTTDTTNTSNSNASITNLDCSSKTITGSLKKGEAVSSVSFSIKYEGGNGKSFNSQSINSSVVTGLTAKLNAGTLANGNGSLTYLVTGTPSSEGNATFAINIGGKTCSITLEVTAFNQNPKSGYGPDVKDVEGNTYKTVYIGKQLWMAQNLNVSKYNDGSSIPLITQNSNWQNTTTGAWCYFNNIPPTNTKYGKLYNWYVVNKNVCPVGWHVPDTSDWNVLFNSLGSFVFAGSYLKESGTTNWATPNTDATNSSLFTALPGGMRLSSGGFEDFYTQGFWWSSSQTNDFGIYNGYYINLYAISGTAITVNYDKKGAMSIRCLQD